jgi:hypothetical protein
MLVQEMVSKRSIPANLEREQVKGAILPDQFRREAETAMPAMLRGDTPVPDKEPIAGCQVVRSAEGFEYLRPPYPQPSIEEYYRELRETAAGLTGAKLELVTTLDYDTQAGRKSYPFYMVRSTDIGRDDPVVLVRANVHGREIGSGLAMLRDLSHLVDYVHARGLKIVVLPMDNPSGYETMNYRNIEVTEKRLYDRDDFKGNNLGVVYVLGDGREVDDIGDAKTTIDPETGRPFEVVGWRSVLDAETPIYLPNEVLALHRAIGMIPGKICACLDFHQDPFGVVPYAYAFKFGQDESQYTSIVARIGRAVTVVRNVDNESNPLLIDNYEPTVFSLGVPALPEAQPVIADDGDFHEMVDSLGFVIHHDGTLPTLFERQGVEHSLAVEISSVTPLDKVREVYRAWVEGIADLIAAKMAR